MDVHRIEVPDGYTYVHIGDRLHVYDHSRRLLGWLNVDGSFSHALSPDETNAMLKQALHKDADNGS